MSHPSGGRRRSAALTAGVGLITALLLTGCADRANRVSETGPASGTSSQASSPAARPASGGPAAGRPASARPANGGSAGVDPKAAASIEGSVSSADSLLKELDQDFQSDAADAG